MLWRAFESDRRAVLLIDEIDKADLEFPNDLLRELDRMEFYVYETRQLVKRASGRSFSSLCNHEKTSGRVPATLLLPLHPVPDPGNDGKDRRRAFPGAQEILLARRFGFLPDSRRAGLKKTLTSESSTGSKLCSRGHPRAEALRADDRKSSIPPLYCALPEERVPADVSPL